MIKFEELKELIENFNIENIDNEVKADIVRVAKQLGYSVPQCSCKDKFADLVIKLKIWLKIHSDGYCHYEMQAGMVRRGPDGSNIYQLNLTDEKAQWILENDPEGAKYIKQILPFEDEAVEAAEATEETGLFEEAAPAEAVEPKKVKKATKKKNTSKN